MAVAGRDGWATKTVVLTPEVKARLEGHRGYPREPLWSVVGRLLDEHDSRSTEHPGTLIRAEGAST